MTETFPGIKRDEIKKCAVCTRGVGHSGSPQFFRMKIESAILDAQAIQSQHGLEQFFGGGPAAACLANVMGPNADLAKIVSNSGWLWICSECFCGPKALNVPAMSWALWLANHEMKPLFIPLKSCYFEAFVSGSKTTEYRKYGARWNERNCPVGRRVVLSKGYGTKHRRSGVIVGFSKKYKATREWLDCYGDPGFAACIRIKLDHENLTPETVSATVSNDGCRSCSGDGVAESDGKQIDGATDGMKQPQKFTE